MSGLCAILRLDGGRVGVTDLEPLLAALDHRGPDGSRGRVSGPCAIGHLHFRTTPEEASENQPLATVGGRVILAFDGRLDNRGDVWRALPRSPGPLDSLSDARLVLEAFRFWGTGAFSRLLGPFAVVLWDERGETGELVLARDGLGSRPLKVFRNRNLVVAASEEAGILAHHQVTAELCEERVATFFSLGPLVDGKTFFEGIEDLLPGRGLKISREGSHEFRCWTPNLRSRIRGRRDEDLADEFRALLTASVLRRMRAPEQPAVMMSGGLDSTPVAALACRQVRAEAPLRTFTWVFDEHPECDERFYVEALSRRLPLEACYLPCDDAWPLAGGEAWPVHPATPEQNPYRLFHERTYRSAAQSGHRVLLSGMTGDQLYGGTDGWAYDLLAEGRWRDLGQEIAHHRRAASFGSLVRGFLPAWIHRQSPRAPWLKPSAAAHLAGRRYGLPEARHARRPHQARSLLDPMNGHGLAVEAYYAGRCGVELRYPLRDRHLVEFMLGIPTEELYRQGTRRPILRRALAEELPGVILERQEKTSFAPVFFKGLMQKESGWVHELLNESTGVWTQYVRPDWVRSVRKVASIPEVAWVVLWFCLSFEIWHRSCKGDSLSGCLGKGMARRIRSGGILEDSMRESVGT